MGNIDRHSGGTQWCEMIYLPFIMCYISPYIPLRYGSSGGFAKNRGQYAPSFNLGTAESQRRNGVKEKDKDNITKATAAKNHP